MSCYGVELVGNFWACLERWFNDRFNFTLECWPQCCTWNFGTIYIVRPYRRVRSDVPVPSRRRRRRPLPVRPFRPFVPSSCRRPSSVCPSCRVKSSPPSSSSSVRPSVPSSVPSSSSYVLCPSKTSNSIQWIIEFIKFNALKQLK